MPQQPEQGIRQVFFYEIVKSAFNHLPGREETLALSRLPQVERFSLLFSINIIESLPRYGHHEAQVCDVSPGFGSGNLFSTS